MDNELQEQLQLIFQGISKLDQKIEASESKLMVYMEGNISKRIDALFDGYKLVHEKQWELERRSDSLQAQVEELQARIAALENKIA